MRVVTIDGPAGSGKSTISKLVAKSLGVSFLDTGAMYRAMTFMAMDSGLKLCDSAAIKNLFHESTFKFTPVCDMTRVEINGKDCSDQIRLPEVTAQVKYVANEPILRGVLVDMQRDFAAKQGDIVTEGRDQGTVVFPDAQVKIFLNADVNQRAQRRYKELVEKNIECNLEEIKEAIIQRDLSDENREVGALKKADDCVEIDTSSMAIGEVVEKVLEIVRNRN